MGIIRDISVSVMTMMAKDLKYNFITQDILAKYQFIIVVDFPSEATIDRVKSKEVDCVISFWDTGTYKTNPEFGNTNRVYNREFQVDIFCYNRTTRELIKDALNLYYDHKFVVNGVDIKDFWDEGHARYDSENQIYRNVFRLSTEYMYKL